MSNARKNEFQVKEPSLETANCYPWFSWQDEKFLWSSKHFERQSEVATRRKYKCWLRIMTIVWTCAKIFSRDEMSINRHYPGYFGIPTTGANIFRTAVLVTTHPWQWPQLSVTALKGWIKVTRYNFYTSWECTKNTNIRCGMETAEWQWRAEQEGFCGSGTCLKHV